MKEKIIPVAPYIPELRANTIDQYMNINKKYLNRLPMLDRTETTLQALKFKFQEGLKLTKDENITGAKHIWASMRKSYKQVLQKEKINPDLASLLDTSISHICVDYLADNHSNDITSRITLDIFSEWNKICEKYNILYIDYHSVDSFAKELYQDFELESIKRTFPNRYHLLRIGTFTAIFASKFLPSPSLGITPKPFDLLKEELQSAKKLGYFNTLIEHLKGVCSQILAKITSIKVSSRMPLTKYTKQLETIDNYIKISSKQINNHNWNDARVSFKEAIKLSKTLQEKQILNENLSKDHFIKQNYHQSMNHLFENIELAHEVHNIDQLKRYYFFLSQQLYLLSLNEQILDLPQEYNDLLSNFIMAQVKLFERLLNYFHKSELNETTSASQIEESIWNDLFKQLRANQSEESKKLIEEFSYLQNRKMMRETILKELESGKTKKIEQSLMNIYLQIQRKSYTERVFEQIQRTLLIYSVWFSVIMNFEKKIQNINFMKNLGYLSFMLFTFLFSKSVPTIDDAKDFKTGCSNLGDSITKKNDILKVTRQLTSRIIGKEIKWDDKEGLFSKLNEDYKKGFEEFFKDLIELNDNVQKKEL